MVRSTGNSVSVVPAVAQGLEAAKPAAPDFIAIFVKRDRRERLKLPMGCNERRCLMESYCAAVQAFVAAVNYKPDTPILQAGYITLQNLHEKCELARISLESHVA